MGLPDIGRSSNQHYFPSDITIKMMHSDYLDKGNACSYETHRKVVKDKKISFAKLGEGGVTGTDWNMLNMRQVTQERIQTQIARSAKGGKNTSSLR